MKKKKRFLSGIFLAILISISSCSKKDESMTVEDEKAYLSFQTFLNDLTRKQQNKQVNFNVPACAEGIPAFVEIILSHGDEYVAGSETSPLRLNVNPNAPDTNGDGNPDYFTEESAALELVPGTYTLEYFTVLDADENILWIAPMSDNEPGGIDDELEHTLPMEINLGAGVKKNLDVEVICFDDQIVDLGGFLLDLDMTEVIEFCIFGNYCNESGRHEDFILYEVDVWAFSGDAWAPKGKLLHEDLQNEVDIADYEDYSEAYSHPLCLSLPDGPGLDEYYIEITHTNTGSENVLIRSGLISDVDVRNLFNNDGTMESYHFREGNCNLEDAPVLLSDHRDILGFTWEFTFLFGDALLAADVVFYPDGTASYQLYGDPDNTVWGSWAYFGDNLFYNPGDEEIIGFSRVSGQFSDGRLSGTFWYNGSRDEWSAVRKN